MIDKIGWGTYLFFAVVNLCFIPIIWLFYPETARRSLEEIDIIFAKGYVEKISYVKAAEQLPFLSEDEVERYALLYGLIDAARDGGGSGPGNGGASVGKEGVSDEDKPTSSAVACEGRGQSSVSKRAGPGTVAGLGAEAELGDGATASSRAGRE